jgi:excisionase family DNA binding protein
MSETSKSPFDLLLEQIRAVVREELRAAGITNSNGRHQRPLTAEELADVLQVDKATVYGWVKAKEIPYLKVGRLLRFNLQAVLDSQTKNENPS